MQLGALIASRICHDLVGPMGAIGNGLELLGLVGRLQDSDEMALISQSVADANARLRFFRIAYGAPAPGQRVARAEVVQLLAAVSRAGRLTILWDAGEDCARDELQAVFLALQCMESALPHGGEVQITRAGPDWLISAESDRVQADPALWARIGAAGDIAGLIPAQVQFALLPQVLATLGRKPEVNSAPGRLELRF